VFAHNKLDIYQKKYGFYAKVGDNPLRISKIVVPLHRQSEMIDTSIED
jgi:hypothetical protein